MNAREYMLARHLLAEEKVGSRVRAHDRAEMAEADQTADILRTRGMVSDEPR